MNTLKETVGLDLRYSEWATSRLLEACKQLSIEERNRDLSCSHSSVLGTIFHFHVSERFWAECLLADKIPPLHEIAAEPVPGELDLEELARENDKVWMTFHSWFNSATEEQLAQPMGCRISAAVDYPYIRWQLIRHVVNHSSNHRGQVIGMIRALGHKPPNIDVMSYLLKAYL